MKFFLTVLVLSVINILSVKADCGLSISASGVNITWNQNFNVQAITVTVSKSKNPTCDYGVSFTRGGAADYSSRRMTNGASTLSYQLYGDVSLTKILKDKPDIASADNVIVGSFPSGKNLTQSVTYYLQIPLQAATVPTFKPSGTYSDSFAVKVYEGSNPTGFRNAEDSSTVNLTTVIPKIIDISLVNPGGAFDVNQTTKTLNFGTISQGQTQSVDLMVRTNAGYALSLSSQNNGVMKHVNGSVTTVVSYTLSVSSVQRNLSTSSSSPVQVASGSGQSSLSGVTHPIQVQMGNPDNSIAGQYTDYITITAATTE